jgi:hypothetical protein
MSQLYVDNIKNRTGGAVGFPTGIVVTGVATFNNNVSIAGTITYEDVANVDSVGVITARSGVRIGAGESIGPVSGTVYYYGDGSNLSNTGSTLSAASGTQRVVVTSQTSGTMTASATDADITFNAGNNTLYVGTASSSFVAPRAIGIGTTNIEGRDAGIGTAAGTVIFNNDADGGTGQLEVYTGKGWVGVTSEAKVNSFIATGGDVEALSPGNGFIYHTFTSSGSFVVSTGSKTADIFVVGPGGGGAAGNGSSGGGGAGGIVLAQNYVLQPGTYTITIPSGGAGGASTNDPGTTGGDTTVTHPQPLSLTAKGGGRGDGWGPGNNAGPGGSGGGGGGPEFQSGAPGIQPSTPQTAPGATISLYGNAGGNSTPSPPWMGGGGGGAGAAGSNGPPGSGGAGSPFPAFNGPLIGVPTVGPNFAGGGGGGSEVPYGPGGAGGAGGGGPGAPSSGGPGTPGTANSGGGGGAATWFPGPGGTAGGNGGSGIVIIRYLA